MKGMLRFAALLPTFTFLLALNSQAQRTTTYTDETRNNTSACGTPFSSYVKDPSQDACHVDFPGAKDDDATAGNDSNNFPHNPTVGQVVDTITFDATPANVADFAHDGVDIHNLVPGFTGKIFANVLLWHTGPGTDGTFNYHGKLPNPPGLNIDQAGGHFVVGYNSDDVRQINAQLAFMQRLNLDGVVANPPGPLPQAMASQNSTDVVVNHALETLRANLPTGFLYSVMADHEMWDGNSRCKVLNPDGSLNRGAFDPSCVEKIMICSLDYMNTPVNTPFTCVLDGLSYMGGGYFSDSRYWKVAGQPVLSYFMNEPAYFTACATTTCNIYNDNRPGLTCTNSAQCWDLIFGGINHHITSSSFGVAPFVIYRDAFGQHSNHGPSNGSFRWINPSQDQTLNDIPPSSMADSCGYSCWLGNIGQNVALGVAFGKVDHAQSPFQIGDHLIVDAQCGKTWVAYLKEPSNHQLGSAFQAIEIGTWDDYDEGTEMETGIDNCLSNLNASINGRTLSWSVQFTPPGDETTIDHYSIFYSTDGSADQNLTTLANVTVNPANNGTYNFTLPTSLPYITAINVKAVGKSMIHNHMTPQGGSAQGGLVCETVCSGQNCDQSTPVFADFNGDGKTDLLWLQANGESYYQIANGGNGGFLNFIETHQSNSFGPNPKLFLGDFNGDGKTDLLWLQQDNRSFYQLANGGNGGFIDFIETNQSNSFGPHPRLYLADFNHDGKTDLLWLQDDGHSFVQLANGGNGGFFNAVETHLSNSFGTRPRLFIGDFNGDGKPDLLWLQSDNRSFVQLGLGNGNFGDFFETNQSNSWGPNPKLYLGDFNGDGKTDLLWLQADGHSFYQLANGNVASGGFLAYIETNQSNSHGANPQLYLGDFNGDGKTDLLWLRADNHSFVQLANGGNGGFFNAFETTQSNSFGPNPRLYLGDFNGDGKTDLLWLQADNHSFFQNSNIALDGSGNFNAYIETNQSNSWGPNPQLFSTSGGSPACYLLP